MVVIVVMAISACSTNPAGSSAGKDSPVVLTTFTVLQDIAQNVAGDHLRVQSITKPGAEIHEYEPTPGDIKKAAQADLILDNGLGLERWFDKFVQSAQVPHVMVSHGVTPVNITEDAYAGKPNPHAWMSPLNVKIYVDNIVKAFSDLDPEHASDYAANGQSYQASLQKVHNELTVSLSAVPAKQRALVSCEGAFSYLTRDAGMQQKYLWPVNADHEGTPQQKASAIDFVRTHHVPAVFCESTVSAKPMQQVVEATGARFGGTLYVDSLSAADGPVPTYLKLIRYDTRTIIAGLTGKSS